MTHLHFIRPFWLFMLLPIAWLGYFLSKKTSQGQAWQQVCDAHLLPYLMQLNSLKRGLSLSLFLLSATCMVIGLAGPTWSRLPVPVYQPIKPRVLILDMSQAMLDRDVLPDRLTRAKFKLHDLFQRSELGQVGLIVYSGEPFIVSPLTEDAKTIDALLSSLTIDIMPVDGERLDLALETAASLITQAKFKQGDLLVLTAKPPSIQAIDTAASLAKKGIYSSILPISAVPSVAQVFKQFATAGQGQLFSLNDSMATFNQWLTTSKQDYRLDISQQDIPVWRDEGRWFLIPALLLLLPAFRRGWLLRVKV